MDAKIKQWIESGEHLPVLVRDEECRTVFFDTMFDMTYDIITPQERSKDDFSSETMKKYIFDVFLAFMASYGYVLRPSMVKQNFHDLDSTITAYVAGDYGNCHPPMDRALESWRSRLMYLPVEFRDFHQSKDLFRSIHDGDEYGPACASLGVNFRTGMCYIQDCFLWFLARHGMVMMRSRKALPFPDVDDEIERIKEHRSRIFADLSAIKR